MPERHIYRGMILKGRSIAKGTGSGELLYTDTPISFLGGVDAATGIVIDEKHPLHGQSVAGKVLAFPYGKGSTVGSYVMYGLARNNVAPAAIINTMVMYQPSPERLPSMAVPARFPLQNESSLALHSCGTKQLCRIVCGV